MIQDVPETRGWNVADEDERKRESGAEAGPAVYRTGQKLALESKTRKSS